MSRTLCIALILMAVVWAPLGCDLDNPEKDTAAPGIDTAGPGEDTDAPPEDTIEPPEDTVEPPGDIMYEDFGPEGPPTDTVIPPEDTVIPPEDTVIPPEDTVIPPEDTIVPPEDTVVPPECVKEGEMGSSMMTPMECCEGLDMISVTNWDPAFPEMCGMMSDVFLCAKCGNDHCEDEWENPCNCVEDCPFPGPTDAQALCAETGGSWTDCGSGCGPWACGEPYPEICPAVCIPQCACPAGDGWDPVKGCVTCSCGEWSETWAALLAQVQACQSPDDCVDVPGTSCGCSMNYVVNESADLWMFWLLADHMGEAGCSPFMSTCSCPAVDGFKCENNTCSWNYL